MPSRIEREQAHKLVDQMPANATWYDLIYEIYVHEVIERVWRTAGPIEQKT